MVVVREITFGRSLTYILAGAEFTSMEMTQWLNEKDINFANTKVR